MVDFRKKLLGLTVLASAFTGMSYGQILCPNPSATVATDYQIQPGLAANLLRVEGTTETVAALNIFCGPGGTLGTGTVTVTMNAQVTSKGVGGGGNPNTDAVLVIMPTAALDSLTAEAAPNAPVVYFGQVLAGSQTVVFSNVTFPTGAQDYTMSIQNIRVNASQVSTSPGANQVTEQVLVTDAGVGIFAPQSQLVGLVYQGFSPAVVSGQTNFLMCLPTAGNAGTITVTENFGGAFKSLWAQGLLQTSTGQCGGATCTTTNSDSGTATLLANGTNGNEGGATNLPAFSASTGLATHGTRFQFVFANIPTGVTLTVPTQILGSSIDGGHENLTLDLTASATGPFSQLASGVLANVGGTSTAVYEVALTDNTVQNESFSLTVTASAAANFSTSAQPAFTVVETVAPQVPISPTSDIPDFNTATPAPQNLSTWSLCQTTLLFPFVSTNGVETGIALSNTSLDPGKIGIAGGTATPNQGSCILNFYGALAATPGTATTVLGVNAPNPTGGATPYTQPAGTSNAFAIGASGLVPSGFSGYMIAQCNYLYGHGFAYIAYQLGTTTGSTMGFVANVLTTRPESFPTPESLGN